MNFSMSSGGIVSYEASDTDIEAWVRVKPTDEDRLQIVEVYLTSEAGPIRSDHLRKVPLGRIETFINRPDKRAWLLEHFKGPHRTLEDAARRARENGLTVEEVQERMAARQRRKIAKLSV